MAWIFSTLISLAVGSIFGFIQERAGQIGYPAAPRTSIVESQPRLFPLPTVVTNLGEPRSTWIRIEGGVVMASEVAGQAQMFALISQDILAYLHVLPASALQGSSGLDALKAELQEIVRLRSGGRISDLIISSLVLQ